MSYLDRIHECNTYDLSHFKPLIIGNAVLGWVKHAFAQELKYWPYVFTVTSEQVILGIGGSESAPGIIVRRTEALDIVNQHLVASGIINQTHGERYPVKAEFDHTEALVIDRASAPYYGIRAWGQHLNGYVKKNGQLLMWIARRSKSKSTFSGKLDNMVAGGLPIDITLKKNIAKECQEEASLPLDLLSPLKAVGAINYCVEIGKGLKPDVMFCYDLELPESFIPRCQDGEVEEFYLLPVEEVAQIVRETNDFKLNCNLVIIDFLVRHGCIRPDEGNYLQIVSGLRQSLGIYSRAGT